MNDVYVSGRSPWIWDSVGQVVNFEYDSSATRIT